MRAIVPVAGTGTRLRPHTHTTPKVLLHVAGKPILGHILDELVAIGVDRISFIVGYMGDMVRTYVQAAYPDLQAEYVEQEERLGLGHAIWLARSTVTDPGEPVLIILGDTIFRADLAPVLKSGVSMIGVKEVDEPHRFGIVELDNGHIRRLVEKPKKPKTNLAIIGIYYLLNSGELFDALGRIIERGQRTKGEFQLTDALQEMIDGGRKMRTFSVDGWYDCGKPETLLETNRVLLDAKNQASADECAKNFPGNIFNGPVYVAPDAEIHNSIIGPYVAVATRCVIRDSIIHDSILSSQARVEEMVLDQSIISDKAVIVGEAFRLSVGDSSEIRFGRGRDEDAG